MTKPTLTLRSWRNYDAKAVSLANACNTGADTKVIQSARDDADINVIVKRFGVTGQLPVHQKQPVIGDFDSVVDYRTALQAVRTAAEAFMNLPSTLRERFQNDPQEYLDFTSKPENLEEMYKLGLAERPKRAPLTPSPIPTPPAQPNAAPEGPASPANPKPAQPDQFPT